MKSARFMRVAEALRPTVAISVDGAPVTALRGDTVLTALLTNGIPVRTSEFGGEPRAGFCVMGACQDCWINLADGGRVRACTTFVREGLSVITAWPTESQ